MKKFLSNMLKLTIALVVVAAMLGAGFSPIVHAAAARSPTMTFDLYARTGTATLFGSTTVSIWGYSLTPGGAATLPGPALVVNEGDCVQVTLHNMLTENSALLFQGQGLAPDTTGAAPNGTAVYTFTAGKAGTFLYEAGLIPGKQHQVAMGLYGAFIVNSTLAGTAYGTSSSAFSQEKMVVLSEFDPTLAASPTTFDMRNYAPKYFLINGKAYGSGFTGELAVVPGDTVLLRYVNAGLQSHAMSTLGIAQKAIATDGSAFAHPHSMVAETIATGQTLDALVTIPANTPVGTKFALYDANLLLRNSSGFGGMLTFLTAGSGISGGGDTTGPATSAVALAPNPTNGSVNVSLSASISDAASGGSNVVAAEYFIDAVNSNGSGTSLSGAFGSPTVSVNATLSTSLLAALASGNHAIYVHGQDALGNWGPVASAVLNLDKTGPTTSALVLSPNLTNGSVAVALNATASDSASGNSNIIAGEYTIDGGAASSMTVNLTAPTASLSATIPAATVNALSQGSHTISVRSQDALGNWGAPATIALIVDKTAPATSNVAASPNPNNGSKPYNTSTPAVRVTADFSDVVSGNSNLTAAEGFLDAVSTTGTGFVFIASDGTFNSPAESGYSDIPLAVVGSLAAGNHTIYVHAKDAAGNWGAMSTATLVIDKTLPTVVSITRASTSPTNAASVQFTVTFSEAVIGLSSGNFTLAATGVTGASIASVTNGSAAATVTVNTGSGSGTLGLNLTSTTGITDLAGNTLSSTGIPLTGPTYTIDKTAPTFTSVTLNPTSIVQGTATITMTINGAADTGGSGLTNPLAGEYWFDSNAATAFTGSSNVSIASGTLTTGNHTLSVRIKDNVGNWSTVRTATLSVTAAIPDAIFSDGFESGNTTAWSSRSTTQTNRLNVTTTAALVGTYGLQAQGNNTNYVQYNFGTAGNPATGTFDARFYFNPNGNSSTGKDIFAAATASNFNTQAFHVRYRLNGTQAQVQIQVGNTANATWVNITNASHRIEVVWQAVGSGGPNPGTLVLYVDGISAQTLTTTSTNSIAAVRLGSVTNTGNNTLMYFDAFSAKRSVSPLIGP